MPTLPTSSSVFGRLTGRRQTNANHATGLSLPLSGVPADGDRGRSLKAHRRESSAVSHTSASVTDAAGSNVKRSLSLRSHRTNPSTGGSSYGHKARSPSTSTNIFTPLSASPVDSPEKRSPPQLPSASPAWRGKLSHSLTQRFKSTDALPKLNEPEQLDGTGTRSPPKVNEPSRSPYTPMIVAPSQFAVGRHHLERPVVSRAASSSHGISEAPPVPSTGHNPYAVFQQIHETSTKRMATIEYLRRIHEGDIFYFGTLHYPTASLSSLPSLNPYKLGRRATNYWILGYSLPVLLDMNSNTPLEYLKALGGLLQEFETYQSLSGLDASGSSLSRGRVGQMFKSGIGLGNRAGKGRRSSTVTDNISIDPQNATLLGLQRSGTDASSPQETSSPINPTGHEFTYLLTPHLPFEPDFMTTLATLCDTLVDAYSKLLELVPGPDACAQGVGEAFTKADKSIRKILISNVVREFEDHTRSGVKGEVAGLGKLVFGGLM